MGKYQKLLIKILSGSSDANVDFEQFRRLLILFGFSERIKGSHHIFTKEDVEEILNIQENQAKAKPYQVKQVRNLILKYQLKLEENDS
ncbi:type II toxin-antitoxin system HicA family toxin [Algoriphagus mannitolivorans]|uniref:type II toxin-antitoxin system HicA family toxin n=1 Tax=Algoriphagus mannitolivorans TaxID=226504 RepID=UPI00042A8B90|nr:type II toxin-antitoxin system HicA family toxin [Algoriphagus mannitolivorans]